MKDDSRTLIRQYFEMQNWYITRKAYCSLIDLKIEKPFQYAKLSMFTEEQQMHFYILLPLKISRTEVYDLVRDLALFNEELSDFECYVLDHINNGLFYHRVKPNPKDIEELVSEIEDCRKTVVQDFHTLKDMVIKAKNSNRLERVSTLSILQTNRGVASKGRWKEKDTGKVLSFQDVEERIKTCHQGVILLEGPSKSGKTTILKRVQNDNPRPVAICSAEKVARSLDEALFKPHEPVLLQYFSKYDIIAIENIDMCLRAQYLQMEAASLFQKMMQQEKLVILTGIECAYRVPMLLRCLDDHLQIIEYTSPAARQGLRKWLRHP